MSTIALDPAAGDWMITNGRLVLLTGAQECAQKLSARLLFFKGSWFRDVRQGVPWWETVFKKGPDVPAISQMFRGIVASTPGVKRVESVRTVLQRMQRTLDVSIVAIHDSGAIIEGGPGKPFLVDGLPIGTDIPEAA